ncbi:MAG: branched-chain amino acid ABC transporter permease, partial [Oscillospiraceae bacterium]|nr:branched-chain amino acid ABC transporter permease [Oscillospiraceae bacterium]
MEGLVPYLINGIAVGGQYALIAIGYTLVYGILRLINFAHGDVFMVAGLVLVYTTTSLPMYISIPIVLAATVLLGFVIERAAYKPLRSAPRMSLMISAIGVSYLIQNLAFYLTGGLAQPITNPIPWLSDMVTVFGSDTKRVTIVTPFLTVALVFALVALIKKTKIGMGMRAAAKDFETAQLMGVKINSVISMTFVIGSFLAAVGAML